MAVLPRPLECPGFSRCERRWSQFTQAAQAKDCPEDTEEFRRRPCRAPREDRPCAYRTVAGQGLSTEFRRMLQRKLSRKLRVAIASASAQRRTDKGGRGWSGTIDGRRLDVVLVAAKTAPWTDSGGQKSWPTAERR